MSIQPFTVTQNPECGICTDAIRKGELLFVHPNGGDLHPVHARCQAVWANACPRFLEVTCAYCRRTVSFPSELPGEEESLRGAIDEIEGAPSFKSLLRTAGGDAAAPVETTGLNQFLNVHCKIYAKISFFLCSIAAISSLSYRVFRGPGFELATPDETPQHFVPGPISLCFLWSDTKRIRAPRIVECFLDLTQRLHQVSAARFLNQENLSDHFLFQILPNPIALDEPISLMEIFN